MKIKWQWVERAVYLLTLLGVVITWRVDKARGEAQTEINIDVHDDQISEINETLKRHEQYWREQIETNTRVLTYFELDTE